MKKNLQEKKYLIMSGALGITLIGLLIMAYMMSGATIRAIDDRNILVEKDSDVTMATIHDKIVVDPKEAEYEIMVVTEKGEISVQDHNEEIIKKRKLEIEPQGLLVEGDLKLRVFLKENIKRDVVLNIKTEDTKEPKIVIMHDGKEIDEDEITLAVDDKKVTAIAKDYAFGVLTAPLKVNVKGTINYSTPGTYAVLYSVDDNVNKAERKFSVVIQEEPVEQTPDTDHENRENETKNQEQHESPADYDSGSTPTIVDSHSELVLVNKHRALSRDFVPNLSYIPAAYAVSEGYEATPNTVAAFVKMVDALYDETGLWLLTTSSYRGYDFQEELYSNYVSLHGQEQADLMSARPGHSEHQTGLVIDVVTPGGDMFAFSETHQSLWVHRNAHRFGFIVRYQSGKEHITGYQPEAWHLRYVGVDAATDIYNSGLTLDEYLN